MTSRLVYEVSVYNFLPFQVQKDLIVYPMILSSLLLSISDAKSRQLYV